MADVMKIGGKDPNSNVKGVAVDSSGRVITKKAWETEVVEAFNMGTLPTDLTAMLATADVSDCGACSLRIDNSTDAKYRLNFYSDVTSNSIWMNDVQGAYLSIPVPANKRFIMVTPDDFPYLQWFKNLRIRIEPLEVPTEGNLVIYVVKKR